MDQLGQTSSAFMRLMDTWGLTVLVIIPLLTRYVRNFRRRCVIDDIMTIMNKSAFLNSMFYDGNSYCIRCLCRALINSGKDDDNVPFIA